MTSIVITMLIVVGLGLLSLAVVAIGMRGKFSDKAPGVADRLSVIGSHLNGEADAPNQFVHLYENGTQVVRKVTSGRTASHA